MSVREYVGARYVPLFMGEWDIQSAYEPLSIVINQGNSYTSRQHVPVGIPITDTTYWALTGNFNGQLEQYRQEIQVFYRNILQEMEDFHDEIDDDIAELKNNFVTYSWYYNLDKTGTTDITTALQTIVDNLPAGTTLVFDTGTYKFKRVDINKEFFIDFNDSNIIIDDDYGIVFSAPKINDFTLNGNIQANYGVISPSIVLDDTNIVFIYNDNQKTTEDREYYRAGLVSEIYTDYNGNTCIEPTSPIAINYSSANGEVYTKTSFGVKNVNAITFTNNSMYRYAFVAHYGYNCVFENIECKGQIRSIVGINHCVNTTINNINGNLKVYPDSDNIVYPINITNCSNTTVTNCRITSDWHSVSTQGYYFTLNTVVENCVLISGRAEAYIDHSNGINTSIINSSVIGGMLVNGGANIENCNIFDNSATFAHIFIKPSQIELDGVNISNTKFHQQAIDEAASAPIRLYYNLVEGGSSENQAKISWINLTNCTLKNPEGDAPILITSRDTTMPETIVSVIHAENTNIGIISQPNTNINYSEVQITNSILSQIIYTATLFYMPSTLDNVIGRLKIENTHIITRHRAFVEALSTSILLSNISFNASTTDNVAVNSGHVIFAVNCTKTGAATVLPETGANVHYANTYLN